MAQSNFQEEAFRDVLHVKDRAPRPRVMRLDSTTYGVRGGDETRWHWVHRAPGQVHWTCACAQGSHCRQVEQVEQKVRYRELWRAV
jgi:hypothetical protein